MKSKGFTLTEMLVATGIAGILITGAIPSCGHLYNRTIVNTEAAKLANGLQLAREYAIKYQKHVAVCAQASPNSCGGNWTKGFLVFVDEDKDQQLTDKDEVLFFHKPQNKELSIQWRSFKGDSPITFAPTGITWRNNRTFTFCLKEKPRHARAIFLAKTGRVAPSKDSNKDGYHETRSGRALNCA